ncbi:MAG: cupin domain-containing protein [Actinobacteria bacterium]|nr:cupin domain-containing protein [Actinomycetota bacterium]
MTEQGQANVYTQEWQRTVERGGWGLRGASVGALAGARQVGMTVYELDPGKRNLPYHAHHGIEELIVVLRGTPTLRTPAGERELAEGEVVAFPPGRDGAHQVLNRSDEVVRFLMLSSKAPADLIEYPDSGKISAQAGAWGTPEAVSYMLAMEPQLDYFAGEPD